MKVGHFWNICGIGGLLSRYLDREFPEKYESIAIGRGHSNKFGHKNEKTLVWKNRAMVWFARCFFYARKLDIIHVHSGIQWLKYYKGLYPEKKLIIHLHGTKIRGRWARNPDVFLANKIIVVTPDLLEGSPTGTEYLPNPVDEDLIDRVKEYLDCCEIIPEAFHVERYAADQAQRYAAENDLKLNMFDREKTPLKHEEFLRVVGQYEYYIDVKRDFPGYLHEGKILQARSMSGLEALALGCKVIDWRGIVHKGFPKDHKGSEIAKQLDLIYQSIEETTNV